MDAGFDGKTVLVTGGSGGIGQQVVRDFHAEGANVVIHYFRGADRAEALGQELGDRVLTVAADLRNETQVAELFAASKEHFGDLELLIANAGVWPSDETLVHEMTLERWQQTVDSNMTSVFLCVREFIRCAVGAGNADPAVVVIGSTAGWVGEAYHADYGTAKSGMMYGFVQSMKNEIARVANNGRINAVCPGWTLTPMAEKFTGKEEAMVQALQTIPLRKFGKPKDVSNAVLFLASNQLAGHITGETLFVSGGMEGRVLYKQHEISLSDAL